MKPWHCTLPLTQWLVPATHSPRSVPHLLPPPGSPSSLVPLQSLSLPSQRSGVGFFVQPRWSVVMSSATHVSTLGHDVVSVGPVHSDVVVTEQWNFVTQTCLPP